MPILGHSCPPRPPRASCHFWAPTQPATPSWPLRIPPITGGRQALTLLPLPLPMGTRKGLRPCSPASSAHRPLDRPWSLLMGTPEGLRPCSPASSAHCVVHWAVLGRCDGDAGGAAPLFPCFFRTPRWPLRRPWSLLMPRSSTAVVMGPGSVVAMLGAREAAPPVNLPRSHTTVTALVLPPSPWGPGHSWPMPGARKAGPPAPPASPRATYSPRLVSVLQVSS
jgi:hypothetical protein